MEVFRVHLNHNDFVENLQFQIKYYRENRTKLFLILKEVGLGKPYFETVKGDFQEEIIQVCHQPEIPIMRKNKHTKVI